MTNAGVADGAEPTADQLAGEASAPPAGRSASGVGYMLLGAALGGALALGAVAIGALAIGTLAIGRLTAGRVRFGRVEIEDLVVRRSRGLR